MSQPFALASELKPGTYVCLKTGSPLGLLVRLFCRSPYDHAVLVTGPGEIVQATVWGVRKGTLAQFRGALACANSAEDITDLARVTAVKAAESRVGEEYGWGDLVVIALRKFGLRWEWLLRAGNDADAMICSELVAASGQAAGMDWLCGEPEPALVTPAELAARKPFMRAVVWDLAGQ